MTIVQNIRDSKVFKLIADISVVHWIVTVGPGVCASVVAATHGKSLEDVLLYFFLIFAAASFLVYYSELLYGKWKASRGTVEQETRYRNKNWGLAVPLLALVVVFGAWFVNKPPNIIQPQIQMKSHSGTPNQTEQTPDQSGPKTPLNSTPPAKPAKKTSRTPPSQQRPGKDNVQAAPQTTINAPNGIGISGGNVANPTVNNYGGAMPEQPVPGTTPTVTICSSVSPAPGEKYITTITLQTDIPITRPSYGFLFDGPVGGGDISISGLSTTPYVNNVNLLHFEDRSYAFKLISTDFPGGSEVWNPGVVIKAAVPSKTEVRLVKVFSFFGKEQKPLTEHRKFSCDLPITQP